MFRFAPSRTRDAPLPALFVATAAEMPEEIKFIQLDSPSTQPAVTAEDQARADFHALLASLLLRPPNAALLSGLASAGPLPALQVGNPLALAWEELTLAARSFDAQAIEDEFDALFISLGTPAVNPYGSLYLSGFLMEKPLAALRQDLAVLGLGRMAGVGEPEDHLGALCESMRLLIAGAPGLPAQPLETQRTFFVNHIAPWYRRCLDDVRARSDAGFYSRVADFGLAFLDIEFQAFEIEDDAHETVIEEE